MVRGALAAILIVCSTVAYANDARLSSANGPVFAAVTAAPPPLRSTAAAQTVITTRGASPEDVAGLRAANAGSSGALHIGVVRELDAPLRITRGRQR